MKFAVQAASFSEAIHVGRLDKQGKTFADKEEATDMTLFAVAKYVEQNFGGGMVVPFPKAGVIMEIHVRPIATRVVDEDGAGL